MDNILIERREKCLNRIRELKSVEHAAEIEKRVLEFRMKLNRADEAEISKIEKRLGLINELLELENEDNDVTFTKEEHSSEAIQHIAEVKVEEPQIKIEEVEIPEEKPIVEQIETPEELTIEEQPLPTENELDNLFEQVTVEQPHVEVVEEIKIEAPVQNAQRIELNVLTDNSRLKNDFGLPDGR